MAMVSGSIMEISINGRSSTEAKIVVADDTLPQYLGLIYFIEV